MAWGSGLEITLEFNANLTNVESFLDDIIQNVTFHTQLESKTCCQRVPMHRRGAPLTNSASDAQVIAKQDYKWQHGHY